MTYINQSKIFFFLLVIALFLFSCKEDVLPKPKAQLRLEYQSTFYKLTKSDCTYQFEYSSEAIVKTNEKCWVNIEYPKLKATINLTYRPIENNLKELFIEAEKLTFNHAIKADNISSVPYEDPSKKLYGSIYEVTGNAASPIQFHVTDSTKNFITGAVYFNIQPNYDSIVPAINYLHKDIIHLVESLKWKE
ncbi:MAG: gliding motility lipoprotein GldD [Flavobacteriaceae bacterium]|nr:gliding motility lipoprotein GldD [Flavobacteriaceae bacterium]